MTLTGPRVCLRPITGDHTPFVLRWRRDPVVARQLFAARAPNPAEQEEWLETLQQSRDRIEFVVESRESGRPVGTIGLSRIIAPGGSAQYAIILGEADARGKGIAREASQLLLAHAFKELLLGEVFLNVFADNLPALRLYERLGFRDDPAGASVHTKDGILRKTLCMRLTREDWDVAVLRL